MLHGFLVEVDLWDGRGRFSKLPFLLPLLDICIGSWMLRYWLAAAFLCDVLRIVLRLVSIAILWFASPAVGFALLPAVGSCSSASAVGFALVLPAVGFALLPAVGFALLPAVGFALSVHLIILQISNVLLARSSYPCCILHSMGSLAVVPSLILTTGSLAVVSSAGVPSVLLLQSHFVAVYDSVVRFWLLSNTTHSALRHFVIDGSRQVPSIHGKDRLQQRVLLSVRSGLRGSSVPATHRYSPIPLCDALGCVHLHDESFHRGLVSLRGPLVRPTPARCSSILVFL